MDDAAGVMDNAADLINVALQRLVCDRIELPAFSALERQARRARTLINGRYVALIAGRLTADEKPRLDGFSEGQRSAPAQPPLQAIKRLPKRSYCVKGII